MKTFEEQKAFVGKLNIMDDAFFQKVMENPQASEEMLQIILQKPGLRVVELQTQRFLRNVGAHSVVLDLLCQDENGVYINVEMQKSNDDDGERRVRFNHASIDTSFVEKGIAYKEPPEVYIIFLSKYDIFGKKRTIYHIDRVIRETGDITDNGVHEIYVNAAVNDGSDIAGLMQYFKKSEGDDSRFPKISNQVQYFKEERKGVVKVCDLFEEYAAKRVEEATREAERKVNEAEKATKEAENKVKEAAVSLIKNGVSLEIIRISFPGLTEEELHELEIQAGK